MASAIIHMAVAKKVNEKLNLKTLDTSQAVYITRKVK